MQGWLLYSADEDPAAQLLEEGLAALAGPGGLNRLQRMEELAEFFQRATPGPELAFMVLGRREEFEFLLRYRERLAGWRLVLALGRAVDSLTALAYRFRPRYLAHWPEDLAGILALAVKAGRAVAGEHPQHPYRIAKLAAASLA
jgi:hypothetical protein